MDPPIPDRSIDAADMWYKEGFEFQLIEIISKDLDTIGSKEVYTEFKVWAKVNQAVLGGAGGIGGYAGIVHAIGLKQMPNFTIFNNQGTIIK